MLNLEQGTIGTGRDALELNRVSEFIPRFPEELCISWNPFRSGSRMLFSSLSQFGANLYEI